MSELGEIERFRLREETPSLVQGCESLAIDKSEPVTDNVATPRCERYDLLGLLGQGGMGNVYRARNKELGTEVAIKVIHPQLVADPSALKRFEQEAKAASSLTHVNLVAVYDYGKTDAGMPFLVMDLLDGISLADLIKSEGYLDVSRALDIFIQICDALIHAHYKGVVHRDLKPSNVLLTKSNQGIEIVKIIDFGIAKLLAKNENNITQTGDVFGSPAYMSPEQCLGLETDARSDVYSLGCIMYECLTGHLPFGGDNPIQTIIKHINEDPKLFGSDCNDLGVPDSLQSLILNTMEKDAAKRYQTMEELRNDLQRIKDGMPPLREKVWTKPKPKKQGNINNLILMACAVMCAAAIVAVPLEIASHRAKTIIAAPIIRKPVPAQHLTRFQILDTDNRLLYTPENANSITEALEEAITKGVNLTNANFSGMDLENLNAKSPQLPTSLAGADFSSTNLSGAHFRGADLHGAKFTGATFQFTSGFHGCNLIGADFRKAHLPRQQLHQYKQNGLIFFDSNATDADFSDANLPGSRFNDLLMGAKFCRANFSNAHFSNMNLSGADFTSADLKGAFFDGSILSNARFSNADLKGASLQTATGGNFSNAKNVAR